LCLWRAAGSDPAPSLLLGDASTGVGRHALPARAGVGGDVEDDALGPRGRVDEPRANLDPGAAERLEPLIGRASGCTRVVTSHDRQGALAEADLVLALDGGRAAYFGAPDGLGAAAARELYA